MGLVFNPFTGNFDFTGSSSGGGTISGTIEATQVAFGTALDTIGGSSNLTYDSQLLSISGLPGVAGRLSIGFGGDVETPDVYIGSDPSLFSGGLGTCCTNGDQMVVAFYGPSANRFSNIQALIETTDYGEVALQGYSFTQAGSSSSFPPLGIYGLAGSTGSGNLNSAYVFRGQIQGRGIAATGTITEAGVYTASSPVNQVDATTIFTNAVGYVAEDMTTGAVLNIGFWSRQNIGTGTYSFYSSGTAPAYFVGGVILGKVSTATGAALFKGTTSGTVTLSVADAAGTYTLKLPTADGTSGQVLTTNGSGQLAFSTIASGLTIDSTAISGGTIGNVLFHKTGNVVGELTTTGTGTVIALATSPSFTTPILGTPTSGTLTNCTIPVGGVTGLGTNVATWLATPSSANLAAALTDETGSGLAVFDTSPTLVTPAITTTATLTRTSIGATSTDGLIVTNTTAAAAGAQQYSPRLRLTGQGWKTDATAASQTVDWIAENQPVQGAASPTANLVFRSQINGGGYTTRATFKSSGTVVFGGTTTFPTWEPVDGLTGFGITYGATISPTGNGFSNTGTVNWVLGVTAAFVEVSSNTYIGWQSASPLSNGNTVDLLLRRAAAATLQLGSDVNGAAVAQTLQACNGITGTDKTGGNLTIQSGKGTGAGAVSSLIFKTPAVLGSGTTAQSLVTRLTLVEGAATFASVITTPGGAVFQITNTALTDGAGGATGTLLNAPAAGNPTKWIGINDNGTTRYIPAW